MKSCKDVFCLEERNFLNVRIPAQLQLRRVELEKPVCMPLPKLAVHSDGSSTISQHHMKHLPQLLYMLAVILSVYGLDSCHGITF